MYPYVLALQWCFSECAPNPGDCKWSQMRCWRFQSPPMRCWTQIWTPCSVMRCRRLEKRLPYVNMALIEVAPSRIIYYAPTSNRCTMTSMIVSVEFDYQRHLNALFFLNISAPGRATLTRTQCCWKNVFVVDTLAPGKATLTQAQSAYSYTYPYAFICMHIVSILTNL